MSRASIRIAVVFERGAVPGVDRSAVAFGLPLNESLAIFVGSVAFTANAVASV